MFELFTSLKLIVFRQPLRIKMIPIFVYVPALEAPRLYAQRTLSTQANLHMQFRRLYVVPELPSTISLCGMPRLTPWIVFTIAAVLLAVLVSFLSDRHLSSK